LPYLPDKTHVTIDERHCCGIFSIQSSGIQPFAFALFQKGFVMKPRFLFFIAMAFVICTCQPGQAAEPSDKTPAGEITSEDGRVGIGTVRPAATLDVYKGEIKVGSSGASCTKELAGTIRFAGDQLQVCNSYGWQSLAAVAPKQ
jgi:hypothetical protein